MSHEPRSVLERILPTRATLGAAARLIASAALLSACSSQSPAGSTSHVNTTERAIMARHGCAGCHTIPGVPGATASVGPPLDALGKRVYVGGRVNTIRNLAEFIQHPSANRPSTMPNVGIPREDAERLAAYLIQLR